MITRELRGLGQTLYAPANPQAIPEDRPRTWERTAELGVQCLIASEGIVSIATAFFVKSPSLLFIGFGVLAIGTWGPQIIDSLFFCTDSYCLPLLGRIEAQPHNEFPL